MQAQANTGLGGDVNILEAMEMFKAVPDQVLPKYAQDPKLAIFAAAEMARREDMRKRYSQRAQKPNKPVIAQLAESMAPSMPMMPPGMNAPQEQQPMQMAPSQQEIPQAGLAGLMPEQRMAGGGPVAFQFGGGVGAEFGGEAVVEEEKEVRVPAIINGQRVMATAAELRAAGYPESTIQQRVKEAAPKPAQPAAQPPAKPAQPQQRPQVIAPQQAPAAQAPMGIEQIIAMGKKAMAGVPQIQTEEPYETAGRSQQILKERQAAFPDQMSPIMEQLKKFYGQQPSQEDIQKAANRQIALSMLGSKDRNFLAGLAGGLQAGEDVKKSMGAENRAMQQASLQAQLAHAKYQDAVRRGDYDAADRAAREERTYRLQTQKLAQEQAMMPLQVGLGLAGAMAKQAGPAGEKPLPLKDRIKLQMELQALAAPKLEQLKKQWESKWFAPKNWEQSEEYKNQQRAIIREIYLRNAPQLLSPEVLSDEEMKKRGA